jgi:hypothetical protein
MPRYLSTLISRADPRGRRVRLATIVAVAMSALVLSACGGGSDSSSTETGAIEEGRYVTAANLEDTKAGSPQATTLDWWKAVQFANAGVAASYYAKGAAPDEEQLARELSAASSQFVGVPQFNSEAVAGGKGTLYFFLGRPGSDAPPRPLSINLVKERGEWKLADNQLLEQQVARVAKLLRERDSSE